MYKSLWDIDIEQGFLLGWDSRTLLICQAIELEGLRIAAALHRWLWVRKPGEHWYPYRVYKNNWQTDVEVLSQFLGRVCALVFVVQRPFKVGFGHIWTWYLKRSEKYGKPNKKATIWGCLTTHLPFIWWVILGSAGRLHLATTCLARRRLRERCQGTTVKDGSCRSFRTTMTLWSTRICVIYIHIYIHLFMLIYVDLYPYIYNYPYSKIMSEMNLGNDELSALISSINTNLWKRRTWNNESCLPSLLGPSPNSSSQAAGRSRRMYKERSMTPTPRLMSERFHEDQKQQKS